MDLDDETSPTRVVGRTTRMRGIITDATSPQMNHRECKATTIFSDSRINDRDDDDTKESSFLGLSLKKRRGISNTTATVQDDHNILRHPGLSAYSRHNMSPNAKVLLGNVRSSSTNDNSSEALKKLPVHDTSSNSSCEVSNYCSNWGRNYDDMSSTTISIFNKSLNPKNRTAASSHPLAFFQSIGHGSTYAHPKVMLEKASNDVETVAAIVQPKGTKQELQIQQPHHHYDHRNHLVYNNFQQQKRPHNQSDVSLKEMATAAAHCESFSMFGGFIGGNACNCSMNLNGPRSLEAALTKSQRKKKERCFQKKGTQSKPSKVRGDFLVQCQSRKRVAEEPSHVEGQVVRQKVHGNTSMTSDG